MKKLLRFALQSTLVVMMGLGIISLSPQDSLAQCTGFCGVYPGPGSCNCDEGCWFYGDCCPDICTVCTSTGPDWDTNCGGGGSNSCAGFCGIYPGPGDCNCDEGCWFYGDCCSDICTECTSTGPEWNTNCGGGGCAFVIDNTNPFWCDVDPASPEYASVQAGDYYC